MKRKKFNYDYEYEYRVYSYGCQVGVFDTRKDAQRKLSEYKYIDKYSYIQVVCYAYHPNGYCVMIGYGDTCKEAKSDLS